MSDVIELTNLEHALLVTMDEHRPGGDWTDTEKASAAVLAWLREQSVSFTLYTVPPWFGLSEPCRRLEDLGLLQTDPGMASFVPPGQPTPIAERMFLALTEAGQEIARELAQADPPATG